VVRDIDVLKRINERSSIIINMSVGTVRTRLARMLEPRAPRPDLRLEAVKKLREAGISVGVNAMPILPRLTDRDEDLDRLVCAARDAGAEWIAGGVLFLMPSSLKQFLPFLEQKFPRLVRQYRDWYTRHAYAPEDYRKRISTRFGELRRKYGIGSRPWAPVVQPPSAQLALGLEGPGTAPIQ
jgi:DNA repair photolyase